MADYGSSSPCSHSNLPMKKYHILKDGQNIGPYSLDEIRARVSSGELVPDDFAWTEGMAEWEPIRVVLRNNPAPASTPAQMTVLPPVYAPSYATPEPVKPRSFWDLFNKEKQPAVHINVKKEGCGSGCAGLIALLIVFGFFSSLFDKKKSPDSDNSSESTMSNSATTEQTTTPKTEKKTLEGNQAFIEFQRARKSGGTSVQHKDAIERVEQKYKGRVFTFEGTVDDVKSDEKVVVEFEDNNYANVIFDNSGSILRNLKKGQHIKFDAQLSEFGTGFLINHDLTEAKMVP